MNRCSFNSEYDIVVCGGGIAGISAAVTVARAGKRVAIIEKSILPGGLAVSGLVNIFLPLCDGEGTQVLYGIAEELLKLSIKYGPGSVPPGWGDSPGKKISRYMVKFSSAAFALALDEMLAESGVDVWYDTIVTGVEMSNSILQGINVFNKSGHGVITAASFVDATGDADIANFAGCKLVEGNSYMTIWALRASLSQAGAAVKFNDSELLNDMIKLGANDAGIGHPDNGIIEKGINGKMVSKHAVASRRYLLDYFKTQTAKNATYTQFPIALPSMLQLRTTRRVVGRATITADFTNKQISNSIGAVPSWSENGVIWPIPEGALRPNECENLLVAGRIISAEEGPAWDAVRSIPAVAHTGELAGKLMIR